MAGGNVRSRVIAERSERPSDLSRSYIQVSPVIVATPLRARSNPHYDSRDLEHTLVGETNNTTHQSILVFKPCK